MILYFIHLPFSKYTAAVEQVSEHVHQIKHMTAVCVVVLKYNKYRVYKVSSDACYLDYQIEYWLQILVIQTIEGVLFSTVFSVSVGFIYYSIYFCMCLNLWFNNEKKKGQSFA